RRSGGGLRTRGTSSARSSLSSVQGRPLGRPPRAVLSVGTAGAGWPDPGRVRPRGRGGKTAGGPIPPCGGAVTAAQRSPPPAPLRQAAGALGEEDEEGIEGTALGRAAGQARATAAPARPRRTNHRP